ncbi:MAG: tRNA dimethylallyltransferase 1 [Micavibrio sp.]|nr:tRNA dimethylallyltransferase 1 [Micavibrio sp.]
MGIATEKNGVIINADSLQIYNVLPLLTAQPSAGDKAQIPHRLYAFLGPNEKYSAQQWRDDAIREIDDALTRNLHPVIVGGTGLYIKALVEGLSPMPDVPPEIRAESMALQKSLGNPQFHAALASLDPVMAARLNPNDTQRLIRAYEVIKATGESLAVWQAAPGQGAPSGWQFRIIVKSPDRAELHRRCDRRFNLMMEQGALDEVREHRDLPDTAPATHALGFHPLQAHLRGDLSLDDAVTRSKAETRQYVKRQDTWFHNQVKPHPAVSEIIRIP